MTWTDMTTDAINSQRVFKKTSPNNKLTLYLASRDLVVENGVIDKIQGVLHVDPQNLENKKLFGQVTLTFRYGREDEEVMGLKFCNEAIMSLAQIWPIHCNQEKEPNTPVQDALLKRLGSNAYPFHLELTPLAPPSVQLVPAKQYHGAPIGTSYDVRAYIAERADEKTARRSVVRMGIRVLQGPGRPSLPPVLPPSPHHALGVLTHQNVLRLKNKSKLDAEELCRQKRDEIDNLDSSPPRATAEKPFLLSDGRVELEAWLDKALYSHGESINVGVRISNHSSKTVRRIKANGLKQFHLIYNNNNSDGFNSVIYDFNGKHFYYVLQALVVQHVDVCMFSNGKFKNVVAMVRDANTPVQPGQIFTDSYTLTPHRGVELFEVIVSAWEESQDALGIFCDLSKAFDCVQHDTLIRKLNHYRIKGVTKNWIALEDSYSKTGASLASTVVCGNSPEDRNVFAIYVSYYVKVKISLSAMGGDLSVKLPFTLTHSCINEAPTDSVVEESTQKVILEGKENSEDEESKTEERDKQNNNGENQEIAFVDGPEEKSPEDHKCVADVLVTIEKKMSERPKIFEGTEVRSTQPCEEELDLIVKYPATDT